ncbi:nitrate/nitrite transporter [Arthrobacter sp. NPDC056691]|uniref:MFS transporter n=1 Tax=Arthrobacter sp. NPDC056691 TaxID=3345913 RepID=UPI00366BC7DE
MTDQVPLTTSVAAVRKQPNPWWVAIICSMAGFIDTGIAGAFAVVLVIYQGAIGLLPEQIGLLTGLFGFGIAFGAIVGGRLGDVLGRRRVFTGTMIVIIAGVAVLMFSSAFPVLVVGALLMGLGTGADIPVALTTMTEAARTDKQRGLFIAFSGVFVALGGISAAVIGGIVGNMGLAGAQILLGYLGVITLVVLILRLTIPESASWLLAREERRRGIDTVRADRSSVKDLLRAPYRVPFLGLLAFYTLVMASAVPIGQYGTYLLVNVAGVSIADASLTGLFAIPIAIVAILLSFLQLGNAKFRFPLFTVGAVLLVVTPFIPVVFGFSFVTYLIFFLPSAIGSALASEGIMKFWAARSFPVLLRNTAVGVILSVGRFAVAGYAIVVPTLVTLGVNVLLISMSIVALVGLSIAWTVFRARDKHSEFDTEKERETDPNPANTAAVLASVDSGS